MKSYDSATPEILYCDNHILVANKPCNMLTQPDESGTDSLENYAKEWVKREYKKPGNVYLHAIHRLDRPVSGLVLFARTSKALSRLNEQSRNLEIQRIYIAEIEGILPSKEGKLDHYLVHGDFKAIVTTAANKDAKHARLDYQVIKTHPHSTLVSIELETGRYHQIRAQFGAIGHPIIGDKKYGSKTDGDHAIHLHCQTISLKHPITQEIATFESAAPF